MTPVPRLATLRRSVREPAERFCEASRTGPLYLPRPLPPPALPFTIPAHSLSCSVTVSPPCRIVSAAWRPCPSAARRITIYRLAAVEAVSPAGEEAPVLASRCCSKTCSATRTACPSARPTSRPWPGGTRRPSRTPRSPSPRPACCCRTSPACPCVVDLAAMRDAMKRLGGDPTRSTRSSRANSSSTTRCRWTTSATPTAFDAQRAAGVRAEPGAVHVPPLGAGGVRQLQGGAAGDRASSTR